MGINVEAKQIGSFNCKLMIRIIGGEVIFLVLRGRVEQPELEIRPFDAESERLREQTELEQKNVESKHSTRGTPISHQPSTTKG